MTIIDLGLTYLHLSRQWSTQNKRIADSKFQPNKEEFEKLDMYNKKLSVITELLNKDFTKYDLNRLSDLFEEFGIKLESDDYVEYKEPVSIVKDTLETFQDDKEVKEFDDTVVEPKIGDVYTVEEKLYKLRVINDYDTCWLEPVLYYEGAVVISGGKNIILPLERIKMLTKIEK